MAELKGRTLIITGASLGIRRAVALELAYMGVNFVLNARTPAPMDEAAAATRKNLRLEPTMRLRRVHPD